MIFMPRPIKNMAALCAACLIFAASPALADVKAGVDAWEKGDYTTAITEWRQPALDGDPDAQFNLGQAYKFGRGVPMDLDIAADWFRKAAEKGHLQAGDNYGLILFQSNKRREALPWLQKSAQRGEPRAQYLLGTAHFNGDLLEKDWVRAYALMTRASAAGLPQASQNLAAMDQYIPLDQRQQGITLAGQLEQQANRERQRQLAGATLPPATNAAPSGAGSIGSAAQQVAPTATTQTAARRTAAPRAIPSAQLPPSTVATRSAAAVEPSVQPLPAPTAPGATFADSTRAAVPAPKAQTPRAAPPAPVRPARSGNWRIQLGAFSTQSKAQALWGNLEQRNAALINLQPYLVNAGKVTRLQAGPFASRSEADRLCSSLKASGQACFAVRQ